MAVYQWVDVAIWKRGPGPERHCLSWWELMLFCFWKTVVPVYTCECLCVWVCVSMHQGSEGLVVLAASTGPLCPQHLAWSLQNGWKESATSVLLRVSEAFLVKMHWNEILLLSSVEPIRKLKYKSVPTNYGQRNLKCSVMWPSIYIKV